MNNRPAVPRGHVDFKAVLRDDHVFPHQLIRDYCPAIINFVDDDRTKCTRLLALQVAAAIGDFKAIVNNNNSRAASSQSLLSPSYVLRHMVAACTYIPEYYRHAGM